MIWIAVDAMGGDEVPGHLAEGALAAARRFERGVALVGPAERLHAELARHGGAVRPHVRVVRFIEHVAREVAAPAVGLHQ